MSSRGIFVGRRGTDYSRCPDCGGIKRSVAKRCRSCWVAAGDADRTERNDYRLLRIADGGVEREHRVVAERLLGRPLSGDEVVHHRNGLKWDNRPENLEVMDRGEHSRLHHLRGRASDEEVRDMILEGFGYTAIRDATGASSGRVKKIRDSLGIPSRQSAKTWARGSR